MVNPELPSENSENKIQCLECKKWFSNITYHVKTHKLTAKEYSIRYPGSKLISDEYLDKQRQAMLSRYQADDNADYRKRTGHRTFGFIGNKELANLLQRDYRSAKICLKNELWKPSIILYGSIIEAILIEKHPESKDFNDAVEISYKSKDISDKEYHKIHIIRDLRNLVHLHKELSEGEEINDYWAKTFSEICESIIKRFGK